MFAKSREKMRNYGLKTRSAPFFAIVIVTIIIIIPIVIVLLLLLLTSYVYTKSFDELRIKIGFSK